MRDVHELSAGETLELFKTLECPGLGEINGEYRGEQLRQPSVISTMITTLFTDNPLLFGKWLSKSFRPVDEGIAEERRAVLATWGTPDQREGIQAFLEKRSPRFNRGSE
jgi:hypothetical protein